MKSKHRRSKRRYSGKRRSDRHRSVIAILLILLFAVAVAVGTVFLGKHLKKKAELSALERESITAPDTNISPEPEETRILSSAQIPKSFAGEYLNITDIDSFIESPEASSEVTILLRDHTGDLAYSSTTAIHLGIQSADNGLPSLDEMLSKLHEKGCYVSVYITLSSHTEDTAALTEALHAIESAVIAEISAAGADEIILCGIEKLDSERLSTLCSLSESIRKENGNSTPIGVLLPFQLFTESRANAVCGSLSEYFEILAADLTSIPKKEEQSAEEALDACLDTLQMYFSRYSLRAVFDAESPIAEHERGKLGEIAVPSHQRIMPSLIFEASDDQSADTE